MKIKWLPLKLLVMLFLFQGQVQAAPVVISGETVFEYTQVADWPIAREGTFRLKADKQVDDTLSIHIRGVAHAINLEDEDGHFYFDQAYAGIHTQAVDIKVGKQPVYLGQGLLGDLNVILAQVSNKSQFVKVNAFLSQDVKAVDMQVPLRDLTLGAVYKDKGEKSWGINMEKKLGQVYVSGEYVKNVSNGKKGYLAEVRSGYYALSYRNIEDEALDELWVTSGVYADSKGYRIRGDFPVDAHSIFTVYRDFATSHDGETDKDCTYFGYSVYF